jgi:DNA-binding NarL/FixJ family response regulator
VVVVGEAGDGSACADKVADTGANVVLLDLAMPELDGLETIPLIRERAPDARIIVFSGFSASRFADTATALGAVRYIEKGTSLDDLRAAVHAAAPSS